MSDTARYRIHLRHGSNFDALDVDWRPNHLRVILLAHRLELDHDANTGTAVPDGIVAREYPAGAVRFVEDLDPPEAHR